MPQFQPVSHNWAAHCEIDALREAGACIVWGPYAKTWTIPPHKPASYPPTAPQRPDQQLPRLLLHCGAWKPRQVFVRNFGLYIGLEDPLSARPGKRYCPDSSTRHFVANSVPFAISPVNRPFAGSFRGAVPGDQEGVLRGGVGRVKIFDRGDDEGRPGDVERDDVCAAFAGEGLKKYPKTQRKP